MSPLNLKTRNRLALEQLSCNGNTAEVESERNPNETSQIEEANAGKYLERIRQLEDALEQSFNYLHELSQKLTDQNLLEEQLAKAEAFANLQHQAIAKLKQQMAQQYVVQAQLQQACWELEQERDCSLELEEQNAALQEQILQQCQQHSEYEAAVQYWKEQALQLKAVLERLLPTFTSALSALPKAIILPPAAKVKISPPLLPPAANQQSSHVDLPPFLKKH